MRLVENIIAVGVVTSMLMSFDFLLSFVVIFNF